MRVSEKKKQNCVGFVMIAAFLLLTSTALAEESLLDQYYNNAHQAFQQGNFPKAKDQLIRLLKIRTDIPEVHNLLAVTYDRLGNGAMAKQHFQTALKLNPDFLEARSNLALHLISQGNLEGALRLVHQDFKEPDPLPGGYRPSSQESLS
jgi:Flp pilus assembly protein TadD